MGKVYKEKKCFIDAVVAAIAIGALSVSIKSCSLSKKTVKEAQASNQIAKDALIIPNKPYLVFHPKKDKNTNFFLNASLEDHHIKFAIEYFLCNVGNTPAIDISILSTIVNTNIAENISSKFQFAQAPIVALSPTSEQTFNGNFYIRSPSDDLDSLQQCLDAWKKNEKWITIEIRLSYGDTFVGNNKTYVTIKHKIQKDEIQLLESKYDYQ